MKKYLWAGALCLLQLFPFAGTSGELLQNKVIISATPENSWKTEYRDANILIESSVIVYDNSKEGIRHERVVFKYTNLTAQNLTVSFDRTLMYNGVCYGCDHADKKYKITLAPSESKEYSDENKDKTYYIFSKDLNKTITKTLDSFHILNIEKL